MREFSCVITKYFGDVNFHIDLVQPDNTHTLEMKITKYTGESLYGEYVTGTLAEEQLNGLKAFLNSLEGTPAEPTWRSPEACCGICEFFKEPSEFLSCTEDYHRKP